MNRQLIGLFAGICISTSIVTHAQPAQQVAVDPKVVVIDSRGNFASGPNAHDPGFRRPPSCGCKPSLGRVCPDVLCPSVSPVDRSPAVQLADAQRHAGRCQRA